jgi:hypothetical protein
MRFPALSIFAALFPLVMLFSGCSWLPKYMEAKAAINARYEAKEEKLELRYSQGQISDENYELQYEELYRQWDNELTAAKARAQGYEVADSRSTTRKRRSRASSATAASSSSAQPARFETYTAEYVGSSSRDSSSNNAGRSSSPAQPPQ